MSPLNLLTRIAQLEAGFDRLKRRLDPARSRQACLWAPTRPAGGLKKSTKAGR
jgi:hypothetical protein